MDNLEVIERVNKLTCDRLDFYDNNDNIIMVLTNFNKPPIVLIKTRKYVEEFERTYEVEDNLFAGFNENIKREIFNELSEHEKTFTFEEWKDTWTKEEEKFFTEQYIKFNKTIYNTDYLSI